MRTPNPATDETRTESDVEGETEEVVPRSERAEARQKRTPLLLEQRRQRILARHRLAH